MAYEVPVLNVPGQVASEDLSDWQFRYVYQSGEGKVSKISAGDDPALGILQNRPKLGESAQVMMFGVSKCVAGSAFSLTAVLGHDDFGKASAGLAATHATAVSLEAATAADQIVTVAVNTIHRGARYEV